MPYIDQNGLTWTRSEDLLSITCEDGRKVLGNEQMTDEYMASVAYIPPPKSDSEKVIELENQLKALIEKLNQ